MGGFLQSVMFGYGGFRFEADSLIFNPKLPPNAHAFNLFGVDYLGSFLDFSFSSDKMVITLTKERTPLSVATDHVTGSERLQLKLNIPVSLAIQKASIIRSPE